MATIVRRKKLGLKSVQGICNYSVHGIEYANNYEEIPIDNLYIRWGCTSNLPTQDAIVINSAKAIHRVTDKTGFRRLLQKNHLCPETWFDFDSCRRDTQEGDVLIVRTQKHAQGRGLWVARDLPSLAEACHIAGNGLYINRYIPKVAEFRVFVFQGKVVWVAKKTPANPDDISWNVAKGGRFDNVRWGDWNMDVINNALQAWELSKLHFAGMDVMVDEDGNAYCLEANSAPSQTSPYRQTCVAKVFDYMLETEETERGRAPEFDLVDWKQAIHPGVRQPRVR